jgi:hypothetical protein
MGNAGQINYAKDLIMKLGYDNDDCDLHNMTSMKISRLISELKEELYG